MSGLFALQRRHAAAPLIIAVVVTVLTSACSSSPRSVGRFCSTLAQQKATFTREFDNTKQPPLQSFVTGLASLGEIPVVFERLDRVAPEEIEPDVAAVRDAFKEEVSKLGDAASNPLAGMASGLILGLTSAGPFQRVQDYVTAHCNSTKPGAASATSASGAAAPSTTAATGTVTYDKDIDCSSGSVEGSGPAATVVVDFTSIVGIVTIHAVAADSAGNHLASGYFKGPDLDGTGGSGELVVHTPAGGWTLKWDDGDNLLSSCAAHLKITGR